MLHIVNSNVLPCVQDDRFQSEERFFPPSSNYSNVSNFCIHNSFEFYITVQWTLLIINSLGPVKLLCYIKNLLYPGIAKTITYKEMLNFIWDQENYFVISGFGYISVLYDKSSL